MRSSREGDATIALEMCPGLVTAGVASVPPRDRVSPVSYDDLGLDQVLNEARAEQQRLKAELEELRARTRAADDARRGAEDRHAVRLAELAAAARAELDSIEAARAAAASAVSSEAKADVQAVLAGAAANLMLSFADGDPPEGS